MSKVFDTVAKYGILRAAIYIAFGILILAAPQTVTNIMVYIIAGYLAFLGIVNIVGYFRNRKAGDGFPMEFIGGILLLVLALLAVLFSRQIISIMPIFFGVLIALSGASYIVQAFSVSGEGSTRTKVMLLVFGILFIAAGLLIIFNPFATFRLLLQMFGLVLLALGISEIVTYIVYRFAGKKPAETAA